MTSTTESLQHATVAPPVASIVGLGAGGHAKVVMEIIRQSGQFVYGLLDADPSNHGKDVLEARVLGDDRLLGRLFDSGIRQAFVGLGTDRRIFLYKLLLSHGFRVVSAIHSTAVVSPSARLGQGLSMMAGAVVNADTRVGKNVIVNTRAIIEHDCVIGDHVHIACGAQLAGGAVVERGAFVGAGATLLPGVRVAENSVIGAGAVVVKDIAANVVAVGTPARTLRRIAA